MADRTAMFYALGGAAVGAAAVLALKPATQKEPEAVVDMVAEAEAEAEIKAAFAASADADPEQLIPGLGGQDGGAAPVHVSVKRRPTVQYDTIPRPGEKPLVLTYFNILGLGEVPRLILAEAGAGFEHIGVIDGGEDATAASGNWRERSPTGLLPLISGLGIPRSQPVSQSSTTIRFLADRYGLAGRNQADRLAADVLYETAKDLKSHKLAIAADLSPNAETQASPKGPWALAARIERMLATMPDVGEPDAAITFGQLQLLLTLMAIEDTKEGAVTALSSTLNVWMEICKDRRGIAEYLASPRRFPLTCNDANVTTSGSGYAYANGPVRRGDLAQQGLGFTFHRVGTLGATSAKKHGDRMSVSA